MSASRGTLASFALSHPRSVLIALVHIVTYARWWPHFSSNKIWRALYCAAAFVVTHFLGSYLVTGYALPTSEAALEFYNSMWWVYACAFGLAIFGVAT